MTKRQEEIKMEIKFFKYKLIKLNNEIKSTNSVIKELESNLTLNGVVVPKGTLRDETESNRQNSSIATYTEDSKPEDYA